MPQLSDILSKREKKFKKKSYRPWNLTGDSRVQQSQIAEPIPADNTLPETISIVEEAPSTILSVPPIPTVILNDRVEQECDQNSHNQLDNIQETHGEHLDNSRVTDRYRLDNTSITHGKQIGNKQITHRYHSGNKIDNDIDNNLNDSQIANAITMLSGIQEKILLFIVQLCSDRGELTTGPFSTLQLSNAIGTTYGSIKMSLKRLGNKQLVTRLPGKVSKGGYINFAITKEVKKIAIEIKKEKRFVIQRMDNDKDNILDNTDFSYNSSSNIYKNNTTTDLPDEWKKINFESLTPIGFSQTQLMQLQSKNLNTPDIIQESINHFAFDLENKKLETYGDKKLNVLMGVLRKGGGWFSESYISPQEKAMKTLFERKKAEHERLESLEKELINIHFSEWQKSLKAEEKEKIIPEEIKKTNLAGAKNASLKSYFLENIWPELKNDLVI